MTIILTQIGYRIWFEEIKGSVIMVRSWRERMNE
jgi:hypothetical protein